MYLSKYQKNLSSRQGSDLEHGAGEGMLQWLKCVRHLTNICSAASPQTTLVVLPMQFHLFKRLRKMLESKRFQKI